MPLRRSSRRLAAAAAATNSTSIQKEENNDSIKSSAAEKEEDAIVIPDNDDDDDENNNKIQNEKTNNNKDEKNISSSSEDDETFASYLQKKKQKTSPSSSKYFSPEKAVVTPSPTASSSSGSGSGVDEDEDNGVEGGKKGGKQVASKKRKRSGVKEEDSESPYFAKGAAAAKKSKQEKDANDKKKAAASSTKKKATKKQSDKNNTNTKKAPRRRRSPPPPHPDPQPGEPDGNGNLPTPSLFQIEYSKTSRATCKRCDALILKNSIRVAHRPLFRGKPGFKVYRHLPCAIFTEDVTHPSQVDGSEELNDEDYDLLEERIAASMIEIQEEQKALEPDELVPLTFQGEIRSSPPGLAASLLPFQVEGASWMYHQEVKTEVKGGILADEMGMGKTLQTITTILDHRPLLQHCAIGAKHPPNLDKVEKEERVKEEGLWEECLKSWEHEMKMRNVDSSLWKKQQQQQRQKKKKGMVEHGARAGTLVICPVVALSQWKAEIEKFTITNENSPPLSVCIYHGPNRSTATPRAMLQKYDVVLTTYQVLEADMRKMTSPNRVECPNCGGKFKIDKLRIHLKYFCGEGAERTEAQARQQRGNRRRRQNGGGRARRRGGGFVIRPSDYVEEDDSDYVEEEEGDDSGGGGKEKGKKKGGKGKQKTPQKKKKKFQSTSASPKDKKNKKASSSSKSKKTKKTPKKTASNIKVKGNSAYDSESELSAASAQDDEATTSTTTRRGRSSTRSAAKQASKNLSKSSKQWGTEDDESEDYEQEEESASAVESSDDDGSDDSIYARGRRRNVGAKKNKKKNNSNSKSKKKVSSSESEPGSDSSEEEEESGEEDSRAKRARIKQREALQLASSSSSRKKKFASEKEGKKKKSFPDEKEKEKKKPKGKGAAKKKSNNKKKKASNSDYSSDSSNNSSSSSDDNNDKAEEAWMEGIDMDQLIQEAKEGSIMSPLHSFCWWRIVLDEAHYIKSRSSQTSQAAFGLTGVHRWCLSGTPLQNRVGEFYSLIRFLRLDPMAHYLCRAKGCDCKSLHYRMLNGKCQDCGHGSVQHYSHFNKYVLNPIQRDGYSGDGRRAMFVLKNEVLDKCLLRRTKETKAEDMNLPPRVVSIRAVRLHPVEEDFYNALYTQTRSSFDDYVANGTLLNNYAHIFDLLMRMRQSVDHPYLVLFSNRDEDQRRTTPSGAPAVANGTTDCDICHEPPTDRVVSSCCQAAFCRSCVLEYMSTSVGISAGDNSTPCPSCRAPFSIDLNQAQEATVDDGNLSIDTTETISTAGMPSLKELPHVATGSILRRLNLVEFATSTKIEALVEELVQMRQKSPGSKAIVFSQFVNMLDLIRWRLHSDPCLKDMGLGARALHGGMDVKARDFSLKEFRENNNVRVLLMSLKAGGVALNLTVANHIYLMDPWWNPAAEMQAIDRTHRLGQYRPIRAVRFIAENTVEERILQLQEKKRLVFDGTVGRDAGSLKMLTVDDMKSLFA